MYSSSSPPVSSVSSVSSSSSSSTSSPLHPPSAKTETKVPSDSGGDAVADAITEYERLLSSAPRASLRTESKPGWKASKPDDACFVFALHDASASGGLLARFSVYMTKSKEAKPFMQHTVQITLADGRLVGSRWTNAGFTEVSFSGKGAPPTQFMDRDGSAAAVAHAPKLRPCCGAECTLVYWASNGALRNMVIARTGNKGSKAELFVEPGQTAVENYGRLMLCLAPTCVLPLVLMCFTHPPAIKQGVRDATKDASGRSGAVLPGRVRTVWEKPAMCSPCFGGPRKDIEFTDDAPARLRADVVAMVVAKAALDAVTPESG